MTVMYVDSHGVYREKLAHPSLEAERETAQRAAAAEQPVFTQQDHAVAALMLAKQEADRRWQQEEAQMHAEQQAGQRALLSQLRELLDPKLEEQVRSTNSTLQRLQGEAEQARVNVTIHERLRPSASASTPDKQAWGRERSVLEGYVRDADRYVQEGASVHQAAVQRLQHGIDQAHARRVAEMDQEIETAWRADMVKVDAARAEADRLLADAQAAHGRRQQARNNLTRFWPVGH